MRIRKTDRNHASLLDEIRKIPGVTAFSTHTIGKGFGDFLVGYRGKNYLCEAKDPEKKKWEKKLSPAEEKFHRNWTGQIAVVETIDDVLKMINE